jgi:hypothetical protein
MSDGTPFGFSFAHPWVLLLLLLLPILAVLKGRFGGTAGVTFSSTSALSALGRRRRSRAGALLALLAHLALASLIVALARPQLGRTLTRIQASGVDIMLALDVSRSTGEDTYRNAPGQSDRSCQTSHRTIHRQRRTIASESWRLRTTPSQSLARSDWLIRTHRSGSGW